VKMMCCFLTAVVPTVTSEELSLPLRGKNFCPGRYEGRTTFPTVTTQVLSLPLRGKNLRLPLRVKNFLYRYEGRTFPTTRLPTKSNRTIPYQTKPNQTKPNQTKQNKTKPYYYQALFHLFYFILLSSFSYPRFFLGRFVLLFFCFSVSLFFDHHPCCAFFSSYFHALLQEF
jgi:hypothetical protein